MRELIIIRALSVPHYYRVVTYSYRGFEDYRLAEKQIGAHLSLGHILPVPIVFRSKNDDRLNMAS
ncbi:MAG: hypothetical protein P9M00_11575 [Candidatus Tritonobacter lacicola]|nr:hypothetical protein [Candidatus Tritonobacter lacicola]